MDLTKKIHAKYDITEKDRNDVTLKPNPQLPQMLLEALQGFLAKPQRGSRGYSYLRDLNSIVKKLRIPVTLGKLRYSPTGDSDYKLQFTITKDEDSVTMMVDRNKRGYRLDHKETQGRDKVLNYELAAFAKDVYDSWKSNLKTLHEKNPDY